MKNGCHKSCKSCSGPGASRCIECDEGYEPEPAQGGLRKCKRKPKPRPAHGGGSFACHNTCDGEDDCIGPRKDQCTKCGQVSEGIDLEFKAGECRCPKGKYLTEDEDGCEDCDPSCSKCTGPGPDQCITCSNHLGTPIKAAGAKAGTCVNCGDPAVANTAPCQGKTIRFKISLNIKTKPDSAETIANEVFQSTKSPERVRKYVIPLNLGETIVNQIQALGTDFVFTEFMSVEVVGQTTPADYTFTDAVNTADGTHDVTFEFKKNYQKVEIIFKVIQSNYFLENLPTPSD